MTNGDSAANLESKYWQNTSSISSTSCLTFCHRSGLRLIQVNVLRLITLLRDLTSCYIFVLATYKSTSAHRPLTHIEDLSSTFYDLAEMFFDVTGSWNGAGRSLLRMWSSADMCKTAWFWHCGCMKRLHGTFKSRSSQLDIFHLCRSCGRQCLGLKLANKAWVYQRNGLREVIIVPICLTFLSDGKSISKHICSMVGMSQLMAKVRHSQSSGQGSAT